MLEVQFVLTAANEQEKSQRRRPSLALTLPAQFVRSCARESMSRDFPDLVDTEEKFLLADFPPSAFGGNRGLVP